MRRLVVLSAVFLLHCAEDQIQHGQPDAAPRASPDGGPFRDADLDAGDADLDAGDADGALASNLDGSPFGTACRVREECQEGLFCQYWEPGCERLGECLPHPIGLDAVASDRGICDCDGRWQGNVYTDFPFQFRDFSGDRECAPLDGGVGPDGGDR